METQPARPSRKKFKHGPSSEKVSSASQLGVLIHGLKLDEGVAVGNSWTFPFAMTVNGSCAGKICLLQILPDPVNLATKESTEQDWGFSSNQGAKEGMTQRSLFHSIGRSLKEPIGFDQKSRHKVKAVERASHQAEKSGNFRVRKEESRMRRPGSELAHRNWIAGSGESRSSPRLWIEGQYLTVNAIHGAATDL
jgi:hypothetical protein